MPCFTCVQCGMQYPPSNASPQHCPICEDVRQYVRWEGQAWTTLDEMRRNFKAPLETDHGLLGMGITPSFAIGRRALLVPDKSGDILWDCSALTDDEIVDRINPALKSCAASHSPPST